MVQRLDINIDTLNSIEFNFNYDGNEGISNGFKIFLMDTKSILFVIIKPIGNLNPRNKSREIEYKLMNLLTNLKLDNKERKIWLDLLNIYGIENHYLYEWIFEHIEDGLREKIQVVNFNNLNINENIVVEYYYRDQFSMFENSRLSAKQKLEIVAYKLVDECYDDYIQDNWIKYFKLFLSKFKRKRSS